MVTGNNPQPLVFFFVVFWQNNTDFSPHTFLTVVFCQNVIDDAGTIVSMDGEKNTKGFASPSFCLCYPSGWLVVSHFLHHHILFCDSSYYVEQRPRVWDFFFWHQFCLIVWAQWKGKLQSIKQYKWIWMKIKAGIVEEQSTMRPWAKLLEF